MNINIVLALLFISTPAWSQQAIKILQPAWDELSTVERTIIQESHVVDLRDPASYALIIDNQGVNQSTPGTSGGAVLGGAVASAVYIDRAFKPGNNYSVTSQLAVGLLGAVIGASLDKPAVHQYHFRYALKRHDGEIEYRDSVQSDAFRHPAGMCLELANLSPVPQVLCNQTASDIRKKYLTSSVSGTIPAPRIDTVTMMKAPDSPASILNQVACKLGNQAPVLTTQEMCNAIGGKPI